jgi:radical SAM protein with 4Fe4S-binding SPASM domain
MFRLSNLIKSTLENKKQRLLNGSIMIWNFTNRCNLFCHHCYSKADPNNEDSLSFEQVCNTIPSMINAGVKFVIFSGGEPLIRKDIFDIAQKMKEAGIITYLSTNGMYINSKNAKQIVDTFNYIGISIDGTKDIHNYFRGDAKSYDKAVEGIKHIQNAGGNAGIRFTLTNETKDSFYAMFDLVEQLGCNKLYISHLVYSGRGLDNLKIDITKDQRREYVEFIIDKAFEYYKDGKDIDLVTGNMEMDAILLLQRFQKEYPDFVDSLTKNLKAWGGNSAGKRLGNMDWEGNVKPDPFFPEYIGNYLQTSFEDVWAGKSSDIVEKLREEPRKLGGDCANCKYIDICNGGSRSRAYAIYGDLWAQDPSCYLTKEERGEI